MSRPLRLAGYQVSLVNQDDMAYVTVAREGREVARRDIRVVHDLVPFRFEDEGKSFQALVSRNEKNGVLVRDGVVVALQGLNPDFRKVASLVFSPARRPGWAVYSVVWNAFLGLLVSLALVFGLFSSLDPWWIGGLAVVAGVVSFAIERARDERVVPLLTSRLEPPTP